MIAPSIRRSPASEASRPVENEFHIEKPATRALPAQEKSQKAGRGRSPPRRTAKIAVASGNSPTKTMECAEVTCRRARAVNSGKPTTTPSETMKSDVKSWRAGRFCLKTSSSTTANRPAMLARATVRNTGSKPVTATRVAGSEPLNITTPVRPFSQPLVALSIVISCILSFFLRKCWRQQRQSCTI